MALTNNIISGPDADINYGAYTDSGGGISKTYEFKFVVTQADIAGLGAFLTGDIVLINLPARAFINHVLLKHTTQVAGPSIATCTAQVQSQSGNHTTAFDVMQAVAGTAFDMNATDTLALRKPTNITAVNPVKLHLVTTGANLGVATAGQIEVTIGYKVIG